MPTDNHGLSPQPVVHQQEQGSSTSPPGSDRRVFLGLTLWQLAVIFGVAAYVYVATLLFGVAFRYLCLGAILIGLAASGRADARRFLRDWFPLLLFWIGYDGMRDFADQILPRVAVWAPYALEVRLFGWMTGGSVPAIYCLNLLADSAWRPLVYSVAEMFYWSHFVAIPAYMLYLWWHPPTSARFRRFVYGITLLHILALVTYIVYPAAPPWYVFHFGFQQPSPELLANPAFLPTPMFFKRLWAANPNWFAAIPSLHGAYPVFLFVTLGARNRHRLLALGYTLGVWLATVVLGHHYIIDLLLGALYAWVSAWVGNLYREKTQAPAAARVEGPVQEKNAFDSQPPLTG